MKKNICFFLFWIFIEGAQAQLYTIHTVAGNGYNSNNYGSYSGDGGPATAAELALPYGIWVDNSGFYIADQDNYRIRKVNISGIITTVAGNGINPDTAGVFSGNGGPATAAELNLPRGVASDNLGNFYIADIYDEEVRVVNSSGIINDFAGCDTAGFSGDGGLATAALIESPTGIAVDNANNIYIADWGASRVRKVNTSSIITTIAGNGTMGYSGDGGFATAAELNLPTNVAVDRLGNIYIADYGNNRIRKVDTSGIISTIAGNGYTTRAGGGYSGDGGLATAAELYGPSGVSVDNIGNIYIADSYNNRIRKVDTGGIISTIAGGGISELGDGWLATAARLNGPWGVVTDNYGNIYLADAGNSRIRELTPACYITSVTTSIIQNIVCNGANNGSAGIMASGGTSPYTYSWNNGQTNPSATGLSAGTYTVNVIDNAGCIGSDTVTITQPPLLQDSINSQCATCCNCKGTTHVFVWGGTSPYTYSWSDGRTNDTLMGLASGSYTATITDSNGCTITDTVFVSHGDHAVLSHTNILCHGESDGSASVSMDGNFFSYSWSPGGQTVASVSGLSAGEYEVTVSNTDTSGCVVVYDFTITQPSPLTADFFITGPYNSSLICEDTVCVIAGIDNGSGGTPPYSYHILFTNPLCFGTLLMGYIEDANSCTYTIPDLNFDMGTSFRVQINNNVSCYGGDNGSATINLHTGDEIYTSYSWSPGGGTNETQSNLSAGIYTVTVSESSPSCSVSTIIAITQPPALSLTADSISATTGNCNGSAWAGVSGGTLPYTYSWTGGLTTDTIYNQCAGYYCCTITDAGGCIDSVCTNIETTTGTKELAKENGQLTIYPNPNEGKFTIELAVGSGQSWVEIYNVLGEKVYATILPQTPKGALNEIDLSSQPDGVYFYRVFYDTGVLIGEGKLVIQK